jgi:hypothetical protein
VRVTYALNTSAFPYSATDGANYLAYSNFGGNVTQAMRSRVRVGQQLFNVDNFVHPYQQEISETGGIEAQEVLIQDGTVSDVTAGLAGLSALARAVDIYAAAPFSAAFVTVPVTDLSHHIDFSQAQIKQGVLQDLEFTVIANHPQVTNFAVVDFSIDAISIHRCEEAFPWLASGAPMPEEVECDD